ncbi:hypothetical protein MMC20_002421 [Loxospora ochrophaea]|nr:hypothetical protein [Loxospora ochrophaea]
MEEDLGDSRTASFDRKKPHEEVNDAVQGDTFYANDSFRKRQRNSIDYDETSKGRDASPASKSDGGSHRPVPGDQQRRDSTSSFLGSSPSMNWNSGIKAKIRTSLGGGSRIARAPQQSPLRSLQTDNALRQIGQDGVISENGIPKGEVENLPIMPPSVPEHLEPAERTKDSNESLDTPLQQQSLRNALEARSSRDVSECERSESDGGVIINLAKGQETGEVTENDVPLSGDELCEDGELHEENHGSLQDESDDQNPVDAVIKSKIESANLSPASPGVRSAGTDTGGLYPRKLADLNEEERQLQFRYFHVTQKSHDIDLNIEVHCLVCGNPGHMTQECQSLTCSNCNAREDHFTKNCPKTRKCKNCHERGHDIGQCPYKLGRLVGKEVECDLCQRIGHEEDDCELQWRTSGLPSYAPSTQFNIRLCCFECGRSGHLGNDCPTRNPRKPLGSSTWTFWSANTNAPQHLGISIKGRAEQQRPQIDPEDSSDDLSNFHRPRLPQPVRKGNIRIDLDQSTSHQNNRLRPTKSANRLRPSYPKQTYPNPRDERRRSPSTQIPVYTSGPSARGKQKSKTDSYNPFSHKRQNLSPTSLPSQGKKDKRNKKRGRPEADTYKPMPSAAQNAWKKHRI